MVQLEQNEWCDFWWQEAPQQNKKRVLLVGDSISRAYRPYVNEKLKGEIYVDQLSSSRALDNSALLIELDYMLKLNESKYHGIHFNNGLHGMHLSADQYEHHLEKVIQHIIAQIDAEKMILAFSTPVTITDVPTELDSKLNHIVIDRNKAMERLAHKYQLQINDLYTPMLGKSEYRVNDGYHYNALGDKALAEIVVSSILKSMDK
ncbi:SGNH/GDSL hydrolase family protein [Paenibacillus roseipurpureus]|uniref:SGNH/GDSL hydrolase family protein n=1 Tax=Paenibacillus roseopurpureus TaxID=2918901 RepID=A0AA96LKK0_9BACL|nr:SGNH/GDSL hydrolase family protein [Paenibacillus sp. MBLB1832]WNR42781.1 SGNH/GDSL hydrolase family protein [Paenibacillus sp. MBLB1832]